MTEHNRRVQDGYSIPRRHLDKLFAGIIGFVLAVLGAALPLPGTPKSEADASRKTIAERLAVVETKIDALAESLAEMRKLQQRGQ